MALVFCTACGGQIADDAPSCPKCGSPNKALVQQTSGDLTLPPLEIPNLRIQSQSRPAVSEKSLTTTTLLCLFLGALGVHRFYVGKVFSGLVQLVTLGGAGIWTLIDFIRILLGNFRDAQGAPIQPRTTRSARYVGSGVSLGKRDRGRSGLPLGIGAVLAIGLIVAGVGYTVRTGTFDTSNTKQPEPVGTIGSIVRIGDFEVTITKIEKRPVIAGTGMMQLGAAVGTDTSDLQKIRDSQDPFGVSQVASEGSVYVVVEFSYKNVGDRPRGIGFPQIKLRDAKGTLYSADIGARGALEVEHSHSAKMLSDLNPGVAVTDAEVFQIAKAQYDPNSWTLQVEADNSSVLLAVANWPRPKSSGSAPASSAEPSARSAKPNQIESPADAQAEKPVVPERLPSSLASLLATGVGSIQTDGKLGVALLQVLDIDRQNLPKDAETVADCDSSACHGVGLRFISFSETGISPPALSATLVGPDGKRFPDSVRTGEASQEEFGWPAGGRFTRDDPTFAVPGTTATQLLASKAWRVEAELGGTKFIFPLKGEADGNPSEHRAVYCCADVVGVAVNDVLNLRGSPSGDGVLLAEVTPMSPARIEVLDCSGELNREGWRRLAVTGRPAVGTWCLVDADGLNPVTKAKTKVLAWVNARFIFPRP